MFSDVNKSGSRVWPAQRTGNPAMNRDNGPWGPQPEDLEQFVRDVEALVLAKQAARKHAIGADGRASLCQTETFVAQTNATIQDLQKRSSALLRADHWNQLCLDEQLVLLDTLSLWSEVVEPNLEPNFTLKFSEMEEFLDCMLKLCESRRLILKEIKTGIIKKGRQAFLQSLRSTALETVEHIENLGLGFVLGAFIHVFQTVIRFSSQILDELSPKQVSRLAVYLDTCHSTFQKTLEIYQHSEDTAGLKSGQHDMMALLGINSKMPLSPGFVEILLQSAVTGGGSHSLLRQSSRSPLETLCDYYSSFLSVPIHSTTPIACTLSEVVALLVVAHRYDSPFKDKAVQQLLQSLLRKVDSLLDSEIEDSQSGEINFRVSELMESVKSIFGLIEARGSSHFDDAEKGNLDSAYEKLNCLWALKRGDLQKVLQYKQSLSLNRSNPASKDGIFDLLIDIVRYANHCQPSIELFVLLRKINAPAAKAWLQSSGVLESIRKVLCPKGLAFTKTDSTGLLCFTLLCQSILPHSAEIFFESLAQLFAHLNFVQDTLQANKGKDSQIGVGEEPSAQRDLAEKSSQIAAHLDWAAAENTISNSQLRVSALRSVYLGFYFFKHSGRTDQAQQYAARLFKLGDGVQALWKIAEHNGELFLDIVEVVCSQNSSGNATDDSTSQTASLLALLSGHSDADSEKVRMYKVLLRTKLFLAESEPSCSTKAEISLEFLKALQVLPISTVYNTLKRNLASPVVYYPFFFSLLAQHADTLQQEARSKERAIALLEFIICVFEEQIICSDRNSPDYSGVRGFMPAVLGKALPLLDQDDAFGRIGQRASVHLFNLFLAEGGDDILKLAYEFGNKKRNPHPQIVAVYLTQQVRAGKFFSKEEAIEHLSWLEEIKEKQRNNQDYPSKQNPHRMDLEQEEDELEALINECAGNGKSGASSSIGQGTNSGELLSKPVTCALEICLKHAIDPQSTTSMISSMMLDPDPQIKSAILYIASKLGRNAYSSALRGYLSYLTTVPSESKESQLEVYTTLLKSTDSTKELKTYFRLLEELVKALAGNDKAYPLCGLSNLVAELVLLQGDFSSLSSEIKQLSQTIKVSLERWEQTQGQDALLRVSENSRHLHTSTQALHRLKCALGSLT